jgi:hypothetical protein
MAGIELNEAHVTGVGIGDEGFRPTPGIDLFPVGGYFLDCFSTRNGTKLARTLGAREQQGSDKAERRVIGSMTDYCSRTQVKRN